jgi:hypothetical protein
MTQSEYSHIPFEGELADDKIVCQNCGWHWKVKDGGDDLFVCHKCNADNSAYYQFSNFDTIGAVAGAVGSVAGAVGSVAQAKASKQLSKNNLQKEIDARCGKDKSKSWSKKKKISFNECKSSVISVLDSEKNLSQQEKQKQQEFQQKYLLERNKEQRVQTYLIIGVIAVILGIVVYKKMNK